MLGAFDAFTKLYELKSNASDTPNVYSLVIFGLKAYNFWGSIPSGSNGGREATLALYYFGQGS